MRTLLSIMSSAPAIIAHGTITNSDHDRLTGLCVYISSITSMPTTHNPIETITHARLCMRLRLFDVIMLVFNAVSSAINSTSGTASVKYQFESGKSMLST